MAVVRIAILAGLGGLLFGYDTGVISGVGGRIETVFDIGDMGLEIVVSSVLGGAIIGALVTGWIAGRIGRRGAVLLAALLFGIGAIASAFAPTVEFLVVARVVVGFGIGLTSVAVPMYISEASPPARRGALVSLYQFAITIGILVATLVDEAFNDYADGWRWDLGLAFAAAAILAIGMFNAPESPRYLVQKGRIDNARGVLAMLLPAGEVDGTLEDIRRQISVESEGHWRDLFAPALKAMLIVGVVMAAVQQFTGINTVIYYDTTIFERAGIADSSDAIWAAVAVGAVNVLATLIAIRYVDRLGRKPLLIYGLIGMAVSLGALGVAFLFDGDIASTLSVISLMAYVICFAFSLGPIVWVLISEIYPQQVRGPAMSLATTVNWLSNLVVALTFLSLLDALGESMTFWLYAAICVLSIVFVVTKVPETKGKSLEEIAADTGSIGGASPSAGEAGAAEARA